jgi:hemerythrin-like metal-binding protein
MDRLPWSRWHWLVVAALGITWIIDGLEVTLIGAVSAVLQEPDSLHFSGTEIGLLGTAYLSGAVLGALIFGYLTDRLGRKKLFTVTLGLYLMATFLTAISWNFASFALFRFLTGAAIGGEYSAINSAIDELIPARVRRWADPAINGTFWVGAAAGSLASVVFLDRARFPIDLRWRRALGPRTFGRETTSPRRTRSLAMAIIWNAERMSTGVPAVDDQHKELIRHFNEFHDAMAHGKGQDTAILLLGFLADYTETHFTCEEACMNQYRCSAAAANLAVHDTLRQVIAQIRAHIKDGRLSIMDLVKIEQTLGS